MFNIGGGEFIVIALIALIVLGPQRLPDAARQVGKAMGELRRLSNGFQSELRDAFSETESAAPPPTGPARRDVLHAAPEPATSAESAIDEAVASVSTTPPRARRTPLKAAPEPTSEAQDGSAASAAVPRASRPRTKRS